MTRPGPRRRLLPVLAAIAMLSFTLPASVAAPSGLDEASAATWVLDAQWTDEGLSAEFPEQVVFPRASHLAIERLSAEGAVDRVDASAAAEAAARVQVVGGGFLHSTGDILGPWTGATAHGVLLAQAYDVDVDEEGAAGFLAGMQNEDGGFGARYGFGSSTQPIRSSMPATHDAVIGLEALDALNDTVRSDVISSVQTSQNADGGWPTSEYSDTSSIEGTYHALAILERLGVLDAQTATEARDFIYSLEQATGGFHADANLSPCSGTICQTQPEITTKSTARAILGLATVDGLDRLNTTTRSNHVSWLADRQAQDGRFEGGFRTYATQEAPVIDYRENTRLALGALGILEARSAIDHGAALALLAATQHEGTGGFAMWPGSLGDVLDTAAATRALDTLGELDAMDAEATAATLAANQRDDGSIAGPDWDHTASVHRTAAALLALARTNQTHAVDTEAAAAFILDGQTESGGFADNQNVDEGVVTTAYATRALDAVGALDRANQTAIAGYLAGLQDPDDGYIAERGPHGYVPVRATSLALQTLDRIDRVAAVDVSAAASFLADHQAEDGTYESPSHAAHVTLGLAAADALEEIDEDATASYLEASQTERGGLALRVFYIEDTAMSRHATALQAHALLTGTCPQPEPAQQNPGATHRPVACPGQ